jgi:hypothetical protein
MPISQVLVDKFLLAALGQIELFALEKFGRPYIQTINEKRTYVLN